MENQTDQGAILQLKNDSWLIPGPTNLGLVASGDSVYLVDSGNDKEAGRKILKILREKGWNLKAIVNTHSNADHIGGNEYLQKTTGCEIWATQAEAAFIETPKLEGSFLWGGYPFRELESKFFQAKPSTVTRVIRPGETEGGLAFVPLPGHFMDMTGVMTADGILYAGDCIFGEHILAKYAIPFIYDVAAFKKTLSLLPTLDAALYVPSHGEPTADIAPLVAVNLAAVSAVENRLLEILPEPLIFEEVLEKMCGFFDVTLNHAQYVLVGSTIRSFLSYLYNEGKIRYEFAGNRMLWRI